MRALQITTWHQEAEFVEIVEPTPAPGQIVVRIGASPGAARRVLAEHTQIRADDTDLAYIEIALVDGDGRLHHTEDRPSRSRSKDPAKYWDWAARTLAQCTHHTYQGRALDVVGPTVAGMVTIIVTTSGLVPQKVTIDAH